VNFVTIDPISPTGCNIGNILQSPPGCTQAPTDFTAAQKNTLALRTNWVNFYQTNFPQLHSSAIEEADSNFKNEYEPGSPFNGNAHDDIARDPAVLEEILKDL